MPEALVAGTEEKVRSLRQLLPDTHYLQLAIDSWHLGGLGTIAGSSKAQNPVARKLGLKAGITVGLAGEPDQVSVAAPSSKCALIFWFSRNRDDPSAVNSDLTQPSIRQTAAGTNFVDYRVCSVGRT